MPGKPSIYYEMNYDQQRAFDQIYERELDDAELAIAKRFIDRKNLTAEYEDFASKNRDE